MCNIYDSIVIAGCFSNRASLSSASVHETSKNSANFLIAKGTILSELITYCQTKAVVVYLFLLLTALQFQQYSFLVLFCFWISGKGQ